MDLNYEDWMKNRHYSAETLETAKDVLKKIRAGMAVEDAVRKNPVSDGGYLGKHVLVAAYRSLVAEGQWEADPQFLARIRMKPIRTLSGVATVTVLTKPYPCPGKCVFCPTDVRMPKSYLPDEPGARRALQNEFDPFKQVHSRLQALEAVGHPTEKV